VPAAIRSRRPIGETVNEDHDKQQIPAWEIRQLVPIRHGRECVKSSVRGTFFEVFGSPEAQKPPSDYGPGHAPWLENKPGYGSSAIR
jgi:hypothetical protein